MNQGKIMILKGSRNTEILNKRKEELEYQETVKYLSQILIKQMSEKLHQQNKRVLERLIAVDNIAEKICAQNIIERESLLGYNNNNFSKQNKFLNKIIQKIKKWGLV